MENKGLKILSTTDRRVSELNYLLKGIPVPVFKVVP